MRHFLLAHRTAKTKGSIKLRFRLRDGRNVQLFHKSDIDADLIFDPGIWSLNLQQYQVHARFILLDTVTGYRSQYHQQSFLIGL